MTAAVVVNSNEVGASSDTLTLYGNAPVSSLGVPLSVKRTGAQLATSVSSATITTGTSRVGSTTFGLTNSGDQSIVLVASIANATTGSYWQVAFSSTQKPNTTLAAGGEDKGIVQVYLTQTGTATGTMTLAQEGSVPLCGTMPSIAVTATP